MLQDGRTRCSMPVASCSLDLLANGARHVVHRGVDLIPVHFDLPTSYQLPNSLTYKTKEGTQSHLADPRFPVLEPTLRIPHDLVDLVRLDPRLQYRSRSRGGRSILEGEDDAVVCGGRGEVVEQDRVVVVARLRSFRVSFYSQEQAEARRTPAFPGSMSILSDGASAPRDWLSSRSECSLNRRMSGSEARWPPARMVKSDCLST